MSEDLNLNSLRVAGEDPRTGNNIEAKRPPVVVASANVRVVFSDIVDAVDAELREADVVVGCVAWFTNTRLLRTLTKKDGVAFIVQKEDFLRPDGPIDGWKQHLQRLYEGLRGLDRYDSIFDNTLVSSLSVCSDPTLEPVRCCGTYVPGKTDLRVPKMHHKFAVLFKKNNAKPYGVIAGSWNWTANATRSLENVTIFHDEKLAQAYLNEFAFVAALSEPLDWESEYVAPEWRIGT